MIKQHHEQARADEVERLRSRRRGFLRNLLGQRPDHDGRKQEEQFVEVCEISVEKCFVLLDFNEEHPLYFLDVGGMILILFGQWLFDPNTLVAPDDVFDRWVCDENFFAQFSLRFSSDQGVAFELKVESPALVPAERLSHPVRFKSLRECQLIAGSSQSLVRDLEDAQVIHPVES
jgi:hypothetical protein